MNTAAESQTTTATAWLVPIAGPKIEPIALAASPTGLTLGRHEQCDLCLPADAEKVSRNHARLDFRDGKWFIADLNSRWGTFVNGCRIQSGGDVPLGDGDLIRITPWTFTLSPHAAPRGLRPVDDRGQTNIRSMVMDAHRPMAEDLLALLLESAAAMHAASDEKQLAEQVMEAAVRGTGLTNAVMLRPLDAAGGVQIIASKLSRSASESGMNFSRSLLAAAANGQVAEITPDGGGNIAQSIVQMRISSAICVPLVLGGAVAAFLYLDSRGAVAHTPRPNASAFCVALGRMASLALANLKRIDMERRESQMRSELNAAAAAQKWIMPKRSRQFGGMSTIGESKPGQFVGGDFFDLIELGGGKLAVALGDVSGKGVSASVLMTATQGFLHATLLQHGDPGRAVTELNRFVCPRRPHNKFVTMWVGVFDPAAGEVRYVDAGHSYALRQRGSEFEQLDKGSGLPVGVDDDSQYIAETAEFRAGDRVVVVSDGIIEQTGLTQNAQGQLVKEQFEMTGVSRSMSAAGPDPIADLFAAVVAHAGTDQLSDDATAVLVTFAAS